MTPCARRLSRRQQLKLLDFLLFFAAAISAIDFVPSRVEAQLTRKGVVIMSKGSGKCVQVLDGLAASGAPIVQWTCMSSSAPGSAGSSTWELVPSADHFLVVASHGGGCLAVANGDLADGAPVVQSPCTGGGDERRWDLQPSGRLYRLVAVHSGKCLRVKGDLEAAGVELIQSPCVGADGELWTFSEGFVAPDQRVRLVNTHTDLCADMAGSLPAGSAAVRQSTCTRTAASQQWVIRRSSGGYRLSGGPAGKCLAVQGNSLAADAPVVPLSCTATTVRTGQVWKIQPSGRDVAIVNSYTGRCLDLGDGHAGVGAAMAQRPCNGAATQTWRLSTEFDSGTWSGVVDLPLVPVAAAALGNGKVLFWAAYDAFTFGGNNGRTQTAIFDPQTGSTIAMEVSNTQHDMFCPGTAMLADGRVLVNGGSSASRTSIYNPATGSWTSGGNMDVARGYNADTILDDGKVFTIGGSWSGGRGGKLAEVWSPPNGGWTTRSGIPATPMTAPDPAGVYRGDNHAWLFSTGNGMVFHAGPSVEMNWFDTSGSGSFVSAGTRSTDSYSMCGSAVMYDINRILKLGGAPAYDSVDAVTKAYVIDIDAGVSVAPTGSLAFARIFQNSVVLPDGRVFVAGGQSFGRPFSDAQSVLAGEIWSETTNGFVTVAAASVPRNYHSIALLLPDARVLVGGGGLCGTDCDNNHPDLEFYSPGYLFEPNGQPAARPAITSAPATAGYNATIAVTTSVPVGSFAFIRLASVTHTVNNDQRRIPAAIVGQNGSSYTVATPANSGVAPPGYYMLFALASDGVPSAASMVRID